ncbi:MAG: UvrD-helicase domain-containing protein [Deltaproteobacteria bacterium]|nr:UvrD-helicase domain-containing protein [Deltaproteobacteria bacterium]
MRIEITDDDISYAEKLLLPTGCEFNDERRAFIRCMESRDVVACPGSGKTTALLAKLLSLARKMPLADDRGICVLTHTNVAIDEIKERAGIASASLFRYPNFFGTIQRFVNQFLAVPWYRSEYQRSIVAIENDRFYGELEKLYSRDRGLQLWLEHRGGLGTLGNYWFNPDTLRVGKSLYAPIAGLSEHTDTFKKIQSVRKNVLEHGILSYNDAYAIALRYSLKMPEISQAISNRFCMVFLDETQDTDEHQCRILDAIFIPEQLVIQRIGDPNQAIYHDRVHSEGYWSPINPLHFSDSRRYGETITHLLSTVRLDDGVTLQPCESTSSHPPYLITYQDGEEQTVIRAFSCLIKELSDALPFDGTYKAVGWIGKDNTPDGKLCIPTYFPHFDKSYRAQSKQFSSLISYAAYAVQIAGTEGAKRFLEIILQGITRVLDVAGIKDEMSGRHYTPASVDYFWKREHEKSYYQFREKMAEYFLLTLDSGVTPAALRNQIRSAVEPVWPMHNKAATFLDVDSIDAALEVGNGTAHTKNRFVADNGIVIHIGTVHSVKGETHSATLYLETEYEKGSDASRLMEFLMGNRPAAQLRKAYHQQNLKIAHVAFSRPTHMLAFACRASSITGHEDDLKGNNWIIRTVSELTTNRGGTP